MANAFRGVVLSCEATVVLCCKSVGCDFRVYIVLCCYLSVCYVVRVFIYLVILCVLGGGVTQSDFF